MKFIFVLTLAFVVLTSCATKTVAPLKTMPEKDYVAEKITDGKHDEINKEIAAGRLIVVFKKASMASNTVKKIDSIPSVSFEKMVYDQSDLKIASFGVPVGQEQEYISIISSVQNVQSVEVDQVVSINRD